MKNEELEKIRKKFKELQEKRTEILKLGESIELLEQNPTVKKYLELVNRYKKILQEECMNLIKKQMMIYYTVHCAP